MTYLDDPDHDWSIDPASTTSNLDLEQTITDLLDRIADDTRSRQSRDMALRLIISGALELSRRTDAPLAQCLDTSMIWYYG